MGKRGIDTRENNGNIEMKSYVFSSSSSSSSRRWYLLKDYFKKMNKNVKNLYQIDDDDDNNKKKKKLYKFQKIRLRRNMVSTIEDDSPMEDSLLLKQDYTNSNWIHMYKYIYFNYFYRENWIKTIVILTMVIFILNCLIKNLINLFEQLRKTMVSFYKWRIITSFIIPHRNNDIINVVGTGIITNFVSWINFIKNIFSLI